MNDKSLKPRRRSAVPALAACLCLTAAMVTAGEIEDKLSEWPELPPVDQLIHDQEVRAVHDYLWRLGSLVTLADAERLLAEEPDLLRQAMASESSPPEPRAVFAPGTATMTVVGQPSDPTISNRAGVHVHDGVDREVLLNWQGGFNFSDSAAVLGANGLGLVGLLAPNALSILAGVWGTTARTGSASYGVYGEARVPEAIAVYARHEDSDETTAAGQALYVSGNHRTPGGETPGEHAALIENRASQYPSVLALRMSGETSDDLLSTDNFVTFFARNAANSADVAVGAIEGNGAGGIKLNTSGADIAEYLERLDPDETLGAGDVVGIVGGKVTKDTGAAQRVMVISSGAAVAGNAPTQNKNSHHSLVSFIGQVPVKVRGAVSAGDFIVASGVGDGCGKAVHPERMTAEDYRMLVGRAWETSPSEELRLVRAVVGLGINEAYAAMHKQFEARLAQKDALLGRIEARVEALSQQLARMDGAGRLAATRQ